MEMLPASARPVHTFLSAAALEDNEKEAIMDWTALANTLQGAFGAHVPKILGALGILVIGWLIAVRCPARGQSAITGPALGRLAHTRKHRTVAGGGARNCNRYFLAGPAAHCSGHVQRT